MADLNEKAACHLEEITECPICMSAFNDPRTLPCIHTFCCECLRRTVEDAKKKPGDRMPCPLCRKDFTIPANGVNGVQKSFFIQNILGLKRTLQIGRAIIICDMCNVRNEDKTREIPKATMRCLECQDNYCDSCVKVHQFQKLSRNHQFVEIGSDAKSDMRRPLATTYCRKHTQKLLEYYCSNCKKIVCVSCFVESHASHKCQDVTTIDKEFRLTIQRNSSKFSVYADEMLSFRKKTEIRNVEFMNKVMDMEKAIHTTNQELKDMIDKHTESLWNELSVIKSKHLIESTTEIEEIDMHYSILRSFEAHCAELASKGSPSDICSSVDQLIVTADKLECDHEIFTCREPRSIKVTFQRADLRHVLQMCNNFLGQIKAMIY